MSKYGKAAYEAYLRHENAYLKKYIRTWEDLPPDVRVRWIGVGNAVAEVALSETKDSGSKA